LNTYLRLAVFDTDTYDDRIYVYEKEMYGSFASPALYYKGYRTGALIQYKIINEMKVGIKCEYTRYMNREVISSGLSQINGPAKADIKLQLVWRIN